MAKWHLDKRTREINRDGLPVAGVVMRGFQVHTISGPELDALAERIVALLNATEPDGAITLAAQLAHDEDRGDNWAIKELGPLLARPSDVTREPPKAVIAGAGKLLELGPVDRCTGHRPSPQSGTYLGEPAVWCSICGKLL